MKPKPVKVVRIATVAFALDVFLKGQLKYLNNYFQVTAVSGEDKHLDNIRKREGVTTKSIKMMPRISIFHDIISLFKLYVYFKKIKPEIVHSITPKAGLLSMIAARFANVPVRIHTFTGLIFPTKSGLMQALLINMDRLLCHCATHVFPEGQGVRNDLITYKITNKPLKILVNGNVNGVDVEFFDPKLFEYKRNSIRLELGISLDDFVYVFVGRLVGDKGIHEMVAAFEKLLEETSLKSLKLLLVGPYEHHLDPLDIKTITAINSNINIINTGFKEDVRPFLAISDVFVFPSYREGFPNAVLQAGAMGLPSIVTNISGCNEIIQNKVNGLLISPKNVQELFFQMKGVLSDEKLYAKLKYNSRVLIIERYRHEFVWKAILNEYKQSLEI